MKRLVLADPLTPEGLELLAREPELQVDDYSGMERSALLESLRGASGLIVRSRTRVDAELLAAADALEVVGRAGVGVDNIDMEVATRRGIAVLNAPGGNTLSTAELTIGLILAVTRRIPAADRSVREGRWDRRGLRGNQLHGRVLGVIGAGRIGSAVIRRARSLGMEVLVHDPFLTSDRAGDLGIERSDLDGLLERSDIVTLHVPLTDATRGMIGREQIQRMKPGAYLVNAARGGLVDELALAEALEANRLAGAALDVYEREPLAANHPLRSAPHMVFTPHLGAATDEAQREVSREIAAAVREALLAGDFAGALNAPYIDPGDRTRVLPILELGQRLGTLLSRLTDGRGDRVEVRYAGPAHRVLRPLAAAVMEGFLRPTMDCSLNLVNSLTLAAERGIEVGRARLGDVADYANYVELAATVPTETGPAVALEDRSAEGDGARGGGSMREVVVGGALLGEAQHPRIVRIGEFHVSTVPRGVLLLVRNQDIPGVIGEVGTRLGRARINIAEYHQARRQAGGEALGVITVDGAVPGAVLEEIRALPAVEDVRQVCFRP